MVLVAVSCRSCTGQSRKDRSALVPAGTTIFSCTTEFTLISQNDSGFLFSICRLNPSSFRRSAVQRTEQNSKTDNMLFICNFKAWLNQDQKINIISETKPNLYVLFLLTWSPTAGHLHIDIQRKPRYICCSFCFTIGQSQAKISLFIGRLNVRWGLCEWSLVPQCIINQDLILLAFWWSVLWKENGKIVHWLKSKVPFNFVFTVEAAVVVWCEEIKRRQSSGQLDIHHNQCWRCKEQQIKWLQSKMKHSRNCSFSKSFLLTCCIWS